MQTLPCQNGLIYPYGQDRLAIECKAPTAKKLLALPGLHLNQDGETERTLVFDVTTFDAVAEIVKPRRRRILTEQQKVAHAERIRAYRFQKCTRPKAEKPSKEPRSPSKTGIKATAIETGA